MVGSKHPDQIDLFTSWVQLGEKFYEALTKYPIPLDMRTLRALKKSPLALDLYSWLSYRSFRTTQKPNSKPVFVSWALLQQQFGADYNDVKDFKRKMKMAPFAEDHGDLPGLEGRRYFRWFAPLP